MHSTVTDNEATIFVIMGATGDLSAKKIIPSLFHLYENGRLPSRFRVIGVSRGDLTDAAYRAKVSGMLRTHNKNISSHRKLRAFLELFTYSRGFFEKPADYDTLARSLGVVDKAWRVCTNKIFFLAVPPSFYELILTNLANSGLTKACSPEEGWTRVLIEKPFGKDATTARKLESLLSKLFKEIQIYRIDHYLAKEMIQNVLTFRFSNKLFENIWHNGFVEKIIVRLHETIGVEKRGSFYDALGTLRDVGQNHMLQMLSLVTMEQPQTFDAASIRDKRIEILKQLHVASEKDAARSSVRAQYKGYRGIEGVAAHSQTETFFRITGSIDAERWRGVPIVLESGKRMPEARKEIQLIFKHKEPCLCPPGSPMHAQDTITFMLAPEEGMRIDFLSKKPGLDYMLEKRAFHFPLRDEHDPSPYVEEYEKILFDAIKGDQTLFVNTREVHAQWRFTDPYLSAWRKKLTPLKTYTPDSNEIMNILDRTDSWSSIRALRREIGIIGLGKMGHNIALRLNGKGWTVHGYNRSPGAIKALIKEGVHGAFSVRELTSKLSTPRLIWLMVPADKAVDDVIFGKEGIVHFLQKGDVIVDGGNSYYKDTIRRYKKLKRRGIHFIDVGVSGGPRGALEGPSLMAGGDASSVRRIEPLLQELALDGGYLYCGSPGAGHFVKMVHNGIEYGMMQALAEGFTILKKSSYRLDLRKVAAVYNRGSVIESRLVGWLQTALQEYGSDLKKVTSTIAATGEGEWTVKTAHSMRVKAKVLDESLKFRKLSIQHPSYTGKILSALRGQFGGHDTSSRLRQKKSK